MPYGGAAHPRGRGMFGGQTVLAGRPTVTPSIPMMQCPPVNPGTIGTATEMGNAVERPGWQVIDAYRAAQNSLAEARAHFPADQLHNGPGDAWRHFRWNFSIAKSMGAPAAQAFANAHEVSHPNVPSELAMDLYNNAMGRAFGANPDYAGLSPAEAADLALRSGCLKLWDKPQDR
jgi:hypothetical protein